MQGCLGITKCVHSTYVQNGYTYTVQFILYVSSSMNT
jgi:pyrroloquinoline quinone (PQQ) biosynthesis protein C